MGVTGAKTATIYDDVTDAFVELKLISQDSDFDVRGVGEEDLNGNELWVEDRASLSLAFFDDGDIAQLKAWQRSRTLLKAIVVGLEDYIFWDQPSTILVIEPNDFRSRRRNIRRVVMRAKGVELPVSREPGAELVGSDGEVLAGFVGRNETEEGITAQNLPYLPDASFGSEGSVSWLGFQIGTIILNTVN